MKNSSNNLKKLCVSSMLCAVAVVTVFVFRINIQFLTMDIKDVFLCIAALLFGPLWGLASALAVSLVEAVTVSGTGIYGFVMNFISSAAFCGIAGFIYRRRRSLKGAVTGIVLGVIFMTALMLCANLVITPYYMHTSKIAVVQLVLPLLLPFNLIKGILNAGLTLLLYKPVSGAVKRFNVAAPKNTVRQSRTAYATVLAISLGAIFVCLALFAAILGFNGQFVSF